MQQGKPWHPVLTYNISQPMQKPRQMHDIGGVSCPKWPHFGGE